MASLTEYFEKVGYKAVYIIGDRVRGTWNGIPFAGYLGNDTLRNLDQGPILVITPDLPIVYNGKLHNVILAKHSDIKEFYRVDAQHPDGKYYNKGLKPNLEHGR